MKKLGVALSILFLSAVLAGPVYSTTTNDEPQKTEQKSGCCEKKSECKGEKKSECKSEKKGDCKSENKSCCYKKKTEEKK